MLVWCKFFRVSWIDVCIIQNVEMGTFEVEGAAQFISPVLNK
jgi:hypothetical protein